MKRLIVFLSLPLLFIGCTVFEPWEEVYYHDVGAEGYVYYGDKPITDITISVTSFFPSNGYATKIPISEHFTSSADGYFCIRFIRRTGHKDVIEYSIGIANDTLLYEDKIPITIETLRQSKTNIQLGKINLTKPY